MGGNKNNKALKALKNKSAEAWEVSKAKRKPKEFKDLSTGLVVRILSYLTKKEGGVGYILDGTHYDLNTVCRAWYCGLEKKRTEVPGDVFIYARNALKCKLKEKAKHGLSPSVAPKENGVDKPGVLVLTRLQPELEQQMENEAAARKYTVHDLKSDLQEYITNGGCVSWLVHLLMRLYKVGRHSIEVPRAMLGTKGDSTTKKAVSAQVNTLVEWCFTEFSIDPLLSDCNHRNFLHYAALYRDPSLSRFIHSKATKSVFSTDRSGQTPLHIAASTGCLEIVQLLITKTPSVSEIINKKDARTLTPLDLAQRRRHPACAQAISKCSQSSLASQKAAPKPKVEKKKGKSFDSAAERAMNFEDSYW
eukprot:TRINITY_DN39329_c0_g1_i1.p1 TRINITY_DN39329_c0_g1~~TRINITY_DN39329_c0_g1_i1.p1  ORF type:complete len:388 (+),score=66.49 TRINITY_DN39329_c0_g1_i1:80-1165(+)